MFDDGTNAVTINLPKRVADHKLESEMQFKVPHIESKYDSVDENLLNNFIDSELMSIDDSLDQTGKYRKIVDLFVQLNVDWKIFDLIKKIHTTTAISRRFEITQSIHGMD